MSKKVKVDELVMDGVTYIPKGSIVTEAKVIELDGTESVWEIGSKYLIFIRKQN